MSGEAPNNFFMAPQEHWRALLEHFRRYNEPESSEMVAIIPGGEEGMAGRKGIVLRRGGTLNSADNEVYNEITVTHSS